MEFKNFFEASNNGDIEFLQSYANKEIPIGQIGMPKSSLYRLLDKYGIKRNRRSKNLDMAHALRHDFNWSIPEIASYLKCSPRHVRNILKKPPDE